MTNNILDQAGPVRSGEEIDPETIAAFLKTQIPDLRGIPTIKQFKGGASNLTYQLDFDNLSCILRRPPIGTKAKSAHNMQREFEVMQRLRPYYPGVPAMLAYCPDETLLGADFYVMEKVPGLIPRANLPHEPPVSPEQVRALCTAAIDKMVELHQVDFQEAGFTEYYRGPGYVSRQVNGWSARFRKARTPDVPDFAFVMEWLQKEMPEDSRACIIHNDFRFDNLVYDPEDLSCIVGVLDWEMATVGDPLMDLGGSLAYWIEAGDPYCQRLLRRQPTHLPGMFSRDEVVQYYLGKMGMEGIKMKFYYVFGLFRLAVIIQQIYYRFYHQQTRNRQFLLFGIAVQMLERYCRKLIRSNSDRLSQNPFNRWDDVFFSLRFLLKKQFG